MDVNSSKPHINLKSAQIARKLLLKKISRYELLVKEAFDNCQDISPFFNKLNSLYEDFQTYQSFISNYIANPNTNSSFNNYLTTPPLSTPTENLPNALIYSQANTAFSSYQISPQNSPYYSTSQFNSSIYNSASQNLQNSQISNFNKNDQFLENNLIKNKINKKSNLTSFSKFDSKNNDKYVLDKNGQNLDNLNYSFDKIGQNGKNLNNLNLINGQNQNGQNIQNIQKSDNVNFIQNGYNNQINNRSNFENNENFNTKKNFNFSKNGQNNSQNNFKNNSQRNFSVNINNNNENDLNYIKNAQDQKYFIKNENTKNAENDQKSPKNLTKNGQKTNKTEEKDPKLKFFLKNMKMILSQQPRMTLRNFEEAYSKITGQKMNFLDMAERDVRALFEQTPGVVIRRNKDNKSFNIHDLNVMCFSFKKTKKCLCGLDCDSLRGDCSFGWRTSQCFLETRGGCLAGQNCNHLHTKTLYGSES